MVSVHWSPHFQMSHAILAGNKVSDDTLHIVHSLFNISGSQFLDCNGDCIDFDYSKGDLHNINIKRAGNDGLDFMTSQISLTNIQINKAGDKGFSCG